MLESSLIQTIMKEEKQGFFQEKEKDGVKTIPTSLEA